jgi:hypothetical protein
MSKIVWAMLTVLLASVAISLMIATSYHDARIETEQLEAQVQQLEADRQSALDDAKTEYYRGVYDLCASVMGDQMKCLQLADKARQWGWYEQPSEGFELPYFHGTEM